MQAPHVSGRGIGLSVWSVTTDVRRRQLATGGRLLAALALGSWISVTADIPGQRWAGPVLGATAAAAMAFGPRFPLSSLVVAFVELALHSRLGGSSGGDNAYIVMIAWASYGVGRHARLVRQPWAAAGTLLLLSVNVTESGARLPEQLVFPTLFTAAPWILGLLVQLSVARAQRAESEASEIRESRDEEVRAAAEAERLRIARELHDVAAHSLSVVSLKAQLARRQAEAGVVPEAETLREIERSASDALSALRGVVGALRPRDGAADLAPTPGAAQITELLLQAEAAGQHIEFTQSGHPRALPAAADLAAYRVVQESLTNARRHGGGVATTVRLEWDAECLEVVVADAMEPGNGSRTSGGIGLVGMRERVEMVGGTVTAGPDGDGGWVVRAVVPYSDQSAS